MSSDPRVAIEQVQLADRRWSDALEASVEAPPDLGFAQRVRSIANAAEQEAAALRHADQLGLAHRPHPGARNMQLSHELRPGSGSRRGPQEQWERFDRAVAELGEALEGVALSAIARAFGELSDVARELAAEIERIDAPLAAAGAQAEPRSSSQVRRSPGSVCRAALGQRRPGRDRWHRGLEPVRLATARRTEPGHQARGHARPRSAEATRSPSRLRSATRRSTRRDRRRDATPAESLG